MNKIILTSAVILFIGFSAFAQHDFTSLVQYLGNASGSDDLKRSQRDLRYEIRGTYERPVTQEKLGNARLISDVIHQYAVNWITDYVSMEISAIHSGKLMKAKSPNDVLSAEQKNILNTADIGTYIFVDVNYKYENAATHNMDNHTMHTWVRVAPEIEAEYTGGLSAMKEYLKENGIDKISEKGFGIFQQALISFTVDPNGNIAGAEISQTSGDAETDKVLLEAIGKMPKWKPAENSKGIKVKQEFEFSVGNGGC
jgi:TonB family protein